MEKLNDKRLSFGQRHWFLLCILVAIISPMLVYWVRAGAHKEAYEQSMHIRPAGSDTSYKVASPPGGADSAKGAGTAGAAGSAGAAGGAAGADSSKTSK